jgi:predicted ATP-grasp superfamily ATP-dependent carboligase
VGLDCITGLQSARILARRGIPVVGLAADPNHFCARTRHTRRVVGGPTSGEPLIRTLEELGPTLGSSAFLLPCTDAAVLTISAARQRLTRWYRFVLPDHETVELLIDKVRFAEHAQASGLPIPATFIIRTREDAEAAAAGLEFPAVLKPGVKTPTWLAGTARRAFVVGSPSELLERHAEIGAWTSALIAQTWVEGAATGLYSFNGYFDRESVPQATFIARKIRQWPPETGTSSLGEEVRDDEVLGTSVRLFDSVRYQGLCYLEMKRDPRTEMALIIEPNIGRPTGRSAIAERGGVELLLTAYRDALGEPLPDARTQTYRGVKWIYLRHDLQSALFEAWRGRLTPLGWVRSIRGSKTEAVGDWRDPWPFVGDLRHAMAAAIRSVSVRLRRGTRKRAA